MMRYLGLILLLAATPALATSVVYKYEGADGVITLTDKPLKNEEHPTIIRLDTPEFTRSQSAISTVKRSTPTIAATTSAPAPLAAHIDKQTLQANINQAKMNVDKASDQLTRARIAQLKSRKECETSNYRTANNNDECKAISSTQEEIQLSRARASLAQLEDQAQQAG